MLGKEISSTVSVSSLFCERFQELEFDARIIVALRTEYYGRFVDATQISFETTAQFRQFLLSELSRDTLIDAVRRPTLTEEIIPYGIPSDIYGFAFEPHLVEAIVDDILAVTTIDDVLQARFSGPALPILQLVCLGLYENMKANDASTITCIAYIERGRVEGILMDHIRGAIRGAYGNEADFLVDIEKIRSFLGQFYILQDDNTVVARSRSVEWAVEQMQSLGLRIEPAALLSSLTSSSTLILRTIRSVRAGGTIVDELTLGHDFVAIALERWVAKEAELRAIRIEQEKNSEIAELVSDHEAQREIYDRHIKRIMRANLLSLGLNGIMVFAWIGITVWAFGWRREFMSVWEWTALIAMAPVILVVLVMNTLRFVENNSVRRQMERRLKVYGSG